MLRYLNKIRQHSTPIGVVGVFSAHPRFHLGLFKFNPFRVVGVFSAYPRFHLGLLSRSAHPRFHLGLFKFNPFRVAPFFGIPQVSPGAIQIQPLQGCSIFRHTPGFTWGYYLAPHTPGFTWGYSNSTLSGLCVLICYFSD
jgi:hypothetical protein